MTEDRNNYFIFQSSVLTGALRLTDVEIRGDRGIADPHLRKKVVALLKVKDDDIETFQVLKRSLDRRPRPPRTRYNVAVKFKNDSQK